MANLGAVGILLPGLVVLPGRTLTGVVRDSTNTPCARTVVLLEMSGASKTGIVSAKSRISDATSGVYAFPIKDSRLPGTIGPHCIIGLDLQGAGNNASVYDNIE